MKLISETFRIILLVVAFTYSLASFSQDLTISAGSTSNNVTSSTSGNLVTFNSASSGSSVLNVTEIITELNAGRNVIIKALRSISVTASINCTPNTPVSLTIESQGTTSTANISFGAGLSITSTNSSLSVDLKMRTVDAGYTAYMDLSNLNVSTNGGNFSTQGLASFATNASLNLNGANINSGSGNISLNGWSYYTASTNSNVWGIKISGASIISSTTGNITINGELWGNNNSTSASARAVLVEGTSSIQTTSTGSISITGLAPSTNSNSVDPTYILELSTTGLISSGNNLTVTGNNFGTSGSVIGAYINTELASLGNMEINGTDVYVANNLSTSGNGSAITINANRNFNTDNTSRRTITTSNGNISIIADSDANGGGVLDLDFLTLAPGTGNIIIRGETFNWNTSSSTEKPYLNGTGSITIEPTDASFGQELQTTWFLIDQDNNGLSGLFLGKAGNTTNIMLNGGDLTVAGAIALYGGNITINQNLTSSASGTDVLIKSIADIILGTGRAITTNAGDVILWANSDGETSNGGVFLDAASSITTSGGHVWIGGSSTNSGSSTWNGLTVGNGYAVSGKDLTSFQNEGTSIDWDAGVLLDETTINTGGGDIYIAGKRSSSPNSRSGAGIINYSGTNGTLINSGTGTITMLGETSADLSFSDFGIMTGLHPSNYTGKLTIQSANTSNATAISITASTVTSDAGMLVEDHTRILSTAASGGGISINVSSGTGSALQVGIGGNSGTLDLLSNSGAISVDGGSDAISVAATVGAFKIGSISGDASVPSSTANVTLTSNTMSLAGSVPIVTTGTLTIKPTSGSSFTSTFSTTVLNYTGITGLTIGHSSNTANITVGSITSIPGPVMMYGGTLTINENLSSSSGGAISLYGNSLTFATSKTVSSTGELLLAPQSASTTIGLAGASGTLQVTATHLSTNFANGFSNITIGSDIQTGLITTNAFSLQDNMTFKSSNLTLGGLITMGDNDITLDSRITTIGAASASNYFKTSGIGRLKRSISNGFDFAFPVGLSAYNPVQIFNNNSSADIFSVNVLDEVYASYHATTGAATGNTLTGPRVKRTWNIWKANPNAGSGVKFIFNWNAGEESTPAPSTTALYHHNSGIWTKQTGSTTRGTRTLTYDGYTGSFSPFAIGDDATTLPVTWLNFTAVKQPTSVELNWSTAAEQNTKDFEIQYSTNTQDWLALGTLIAAGNSTLTRNYQFIHYSPLKGNAYNYYRILQRDLDGKFSYSKIISIIYNEPGADIAMYPNPAKDVINIYLAESQPVKLVNMSGASVWRGQFNAGKNQLQVSHLPKGLYLLVTNYGTQQIIIQ